MDLQDPTSKMSKSTDSDAGLIYVIDDPAAIVKKFKRAVTDSDGEVRVDREAKPGRDQPAGDPRGRAPATTPRRCAGKYTQYGPLKADTGEAVVEMLRPLQARYRELLDGSRPSCRPCCARAPSKARAVAARRRSPGLRRDRPAPRAEPLGVAQTSSAARRASARADRASGPARASPAVEPAAVSRSAPMRSWSW